MAEAVLNLVLPGLDILAGPSMKVLLIHQDGPVFVCGRSRGRGRGEAGFHSLSR